ncbi:MAG: hypothetical protein ACLS55_05985 [Lachnospiraceae bacterium]
MESSTFTSGDVITYCEVYICMESSTFPSGYVVELVGSGTD